MEKNKVAIRFLKPGYVEADKPDNFDGMSKEEKMAWAAEVLEGCDNQHLLESMFEYDDKSSWILGLKEVSDKIFDTAPLPEAIELDDSGEKFIGTKAWLAFSYLGEDAKEIVDGGGVDNNCAEVLSGKFR